MKTQIAAFALLLMASAAPAAFAQEREHQGDGPAEHVHEHNGGQGGDRGGQGHWGGGEHAQRPQPVPAPAAAPAAPQARAAPEAPQPRQGFGGRWGGDRSQRPAPAPAQAQAQPQPRQGGYEDGRRFVRRPGTWLDTHGDDTSQGLSPPDRADQEDRQELRDWRRFGGDRAVQGDPRRQGGRTAQGDRRDDHRSDAGGRDDHRWTGDHRDGDHRDGDRRGDHRDRPQWRPGAFPHSFSSPHRFRYRPYIRPPHFFSHLWAYGEILPPAWYGPDYLIEDWWDFDLPAPPPGYDWVRVGNDALLIDEYSGRVVQVVRELFW